MTLHLQARELGQPRYGFFTWLDENLASRRHDDLHAGPEPDHAVALAGSEPLAGRDVAYDAPRDEAGDLNERHLGAEVRFHDDPVVLVLLGSLVEVRLEE